MLIGLDFDNTIVSYESAIPVLASSYLSLPDSLALSKTSIRDYLRLENREHEWTKFQGQMYGPGMLHAKPHQGSVSAMLELIDYGHKLVIVSHRSKHPYAGPPYDLHSFARQWIEEHLHPFSLFRGAGIESSAYFAETLPLKLEKITSLSCDAFVDDLPDVLSSPLFPLTTNRILFDSHCSPDSNSYAFEAVINAWSDLPRVLSSCQAKDSR